MKRLPNEDQATYRARRAAANAESKKSLRGRFEDGSVPMTKRERDQANMAAFERRMGEREARTQFLAGVRFVAHVFGCILPATAPTEQATEQPDGTQQAPRSASE